MWMWARVTGVTTVTTPTISYVHAGQIWAVLKSELTEKASYFCSYPPYAPCSSSIHSWNDVVQVVFVSFFWTMSKVFAYSLRPSATFSWFFPLCFQSRSHPFIFKPGTWLHSDENIFSFVNFGIISACDVLLFGIWHGQANISTHISFSRWTVLQKNFTNPCFSFQHLLTNSYQCVSLNYFMDKSPAATGGKKIKYAYIKACTLPFQIFVKECCALKNSVNSSMVFS